MVIEQMIKVCICVFGCIFLLRGSCEVLFEALNLMNCMMLFKMSVKSTYNKPLVWK